MFSDRVKDEYARARAEPFFSETQDTRLRTEQAERPSAASETSTLCLCQQGVFYADVISIH